MKTKGLGLTPVDVEMAFLISLIPVKKAIEDGVMLLIQPLTR
jgi:uncharacterized protein (UPF0179 family)